MRKIFTVLFVAALSILALPAIAQSVDTVAVTAAAVPDAIAAPSLQTAGIVCTSRCVDAAGNHYTLTSQPKLNPVAVPRTRLVWHPGDSGAVRSLRRS